MQPADHGGYFQGEHRNRGPRNVVGILPGADPVMRKEYVILSAHYDHVGRGFPGANDNASGTASLMEIAGALTGRTKRSVLFVAFYGEEKGLWGSSYYVQHPLVPLKDTVAEINLEQLGRTDDDAGPKIATFGMTGTSLSNLPAMIGDAVKAAGVEIYHRPDEDSFFNRSDNFPFASKGVVDTTLVVVFDFPDYHKPATRRTSSIMKIWRWWIAGLKRQSWNWRIRRRGRCGRARDGAGENRRPFATMKPSGFGLRAMGGCKPARFGRKQR